MTENDKNLQDDSWRFKQVCHETSDPGHPYRRFGTGTYFSGNHRENFYLWANVHKIIITHDWKIVWFALFEFQDQKQDICGPDIYSTGFLT